MEIQKTTRLEYVDVAKFIGIFLVIFAHALPGGELRAFIYGFHLPLFFFLTGITFKIKEEDNFSSFLIRKMKTYLIPMFFIGILEICAEMIVKSISGIPFDFSFVDTMMSNLLVQKRAYPIWFVGALFVSDIFFYFCIKFSFKRWYLILLNSLLFLASGILYNYFYHQVLIWNIDVSFFGVFFLACGYLVTNYLPLKIKDFFFSKRYLSLLVGLSFFILGFMFIYLNYHYFNLHLEMWAQQYNKYYLTIPGALFSSYGIVLISNTIRNKILGNLGKTTFILLAFHQILTFPLFNDFIANKWFVSLVTIYDKVGFAFVETLFSVVVLVGFYYLLIYSPFSFILNKKPHKVYYQLVDRLKGKEER